MSEHEIVEKRFARNQKVSNTGMLLFQLAQECIRYLEFDLYGTSGKHGLDTFFSDDRKERAESIAQTAMELLQEVGFTQEDTVQFWEQASAYRRELEEIAVSLYQNESTSQDQ